MEQTKEIRNERQNWKQFFLEKDILDDFDIFMCYGTLKKERYSLSGIINEFIYYMEKDIKDNYKDKVIQNEIKKHIRGICFKNKATLYKLYGKNI